jgi:hydroxyacyl-ACP dehydratase HTD2-like protein with hotdog domain
LITKKTIQRAKEQKRSRKTKQNWQPLFQNTPLNIQEITQMEKVVTIWTNPLNHLQASKMEKYSLEIDVPMEQNFVLELLS